MDWRASTLKLRAADKPMRRLLLIAISAVTALTAADPPDLYIAPYLQNVTPDGITVMWETVEPIIGVVEYGRYGTFENKAQETEARKLHEIRISGLDAATTYNYRVRYGGNLLPAASFTTAPTPGTENWRFVVYGDNRSNPETHTRNVQQILKLKPGIILNTGDLVAQGSKYEQWKPQYFDPLRGVSEHIPIFPCLGNHEQNAIHYYNYHSVPDDQGEVYYSFDYGNAHIISLNSNARDAPFELGEKQTEWLIEDLKKNKDATWKFVYFHHPLFRSHPTRGITAQRWVWQPVFEEYGVDLVLNGHDHYYMRSYAIGRYTGEAKRGVYHLISGGGGANTYPIVPKEHAAFRRRIHHVTAIDVMGDRLIGRAIDIDGNIFDAFVIDKQAVNSPEEFMAYEIFELERDLGEKIREMPLAKVVDGKVDVDTILEVSNPFQTPLRVTLLWHGTNGWSVDRERRVFQLDPGQPLRIPIQASGEGAELHPVPTATLEFGTPDGEKSFRNDRVDFYPLKIGKELTIEAAAVATAPTIDGQLDDDAWQHIEPIDHFIDVQGSDWPTRRTQARLVHKNGTLYIAALVEAPEGLTEQGYEGRDNSRAIRDDHVRIHLGYGDTSFTFLVNARGSFVDSRGADRDWNSSAEAATAANHGGWQAEFAIPMTDLASEGQPLRINIVRRDQTANRECEISSTFGRSDLDHRVPMFTSDPDAVSRFAWLSLK